MLKSTFEQITPEVARKMLEHNVNNRPVRVSWVSNLASQIKSGEWRVTHQGIALDVNGRLVDGQHRLLAIIEADRSVPIMVTRGLDVDDYPYLDGGKARTYADRLALTSDQKENMILISLVRGYMSYAKNLQASVTVQAVERHYLEMADAFNLVSRSFRLGVRGVTTAEVGAAIASYAHAHPARADAFLDKLMSGESLSAGSPILVLRESVLAGRVARGYERYWKTIAACQRHHEGRSTVKLYCATEDFQGNQYMRQLKINSVNARKSVISRVVNASKANT